MAWETSDRRHRLPGNWQTIRRQVQARADGKCQATYHDPRCNGIGTEADHITPGDDHSLDNLAWLSHECHKAKTARETGARSKARSRKRAPEPHPGLIRQD